MKRFKFILIIIISLSFSIAESKDEDLQKQAIDFFNKKNVIHYYKGGLEIRFDGDEPLSEEDFIHMQYLTDITIIHLNEYPVTDKYMSYLTNLKKLEVLRLPGTKITDKGVQMICQNHPNLEELNLNRTKITSKVLIYISNLNKLTWLELSNTNIDDEGIIYISQLKKIEVLYLYGTRLTDKSVPYLKVFTDLSELGIQNTGISEAGYKQLKDYYSKISPNAWIIYKD